MQGAAQTANAAPSSRLEPARPGEQARRDSALGPRQQPDEREPDHDQQEAGELESAVAWSSTLPIAAAPAPSRTKTTVKPRMNGRLASATRRPAPRSPRRPASTADTAER